MSAIVGLDLAPAASGVFAIGKELGDPLTELFVGTDPKQDIHLRIMGSSNVITAVVQAYKPVLVVIEDFAFAGKFSSRDIAMHAGVIRDYLIRNEFDFLLIPPSVLKSWLNEELGLSGAPASAKDTSIAYVDRVMEYKTKYKRKSEHNHTCDAAALSQMGRMALLLKEGHDIGTEKQKSFFLSTEKNSKGMPKGLLHRPDLYVRSVNAAI